MLNTSAKKFGRLSALVNILCDMPRSLNQSPRKRKRVTLILSEQALAAGHANLSGIMFDGSAYGSCNAFEDGFCDMVAIAAMMEDDMQIA